MSAGPVIMINVLAMFFNSVLCTPAQSQNGPSKRVRIIFHQHTFLFFGSLLLHKLIRVTHSESKLA